MAVWRGGADAALRPRASLPLLQVLSRRWLMRPQGEACGRSFGALHPAMGASVGEPMGGAPETAGAWGDRQTPGSLASMRLLPLLQTARLEAHGADRARPDRGALGRARARLRPWGRERFVPVAHRTPGQHRLCHGSRPLSVGAGSDRDRARAGGRCPALPHHTRLDLVPRPPRDDDCVKQPAQHGFALRWREDIRLPQLGQRTAQVEEGRPPLRGACPLRRVWGLPAVGRGLFRRLACAPRGFPAPLQGCCHEAVVRLNTANRACTPCGLLPSPLAWLLARLLAAHGLLARCGPRLRLQIECDRRQGLAKGGDAPSIDRVRRHILPDGDPILLPPVVTEGRGPPLVLPHPLGATRATRDEAMQERGARARPPTGLVAIIRRLVGAEHGLELCARVPAEGGGRRVRDTPTPRLQGEALGGCASRRTAGAPGARPAIGQGARLRRGLHQREERGAGGAFPDHRPAAVAAREAPATGVEQFPPLAGRPPRHKRLAAQGKPGWHGQMRVCVHAAPASAVEARRQRQRQVAAGRLVEEARRQAGADGVELPGGEGALQPAPPPAMGRGRIRQALDGSDPTAFIATAGSQGIPGRAVPREPCDILGEDEPNVPSRHLASPGVAALARLGTRGTVAHLAIQHGHGLRGPPQRGRPLGEGVLEPETFLRAQRLGGGRWAHVDDRLAGQRLGRDDRDAGHRCPPGRWPRGRRGWPLGVWD